MTSEPVSRTRTHTQENQSETESEGGSSLAHTHTPHFDMSESVPTVSKQFLQATTITTPTTTSQQKMSLGWKFIHRPICVYQPIDRLAKGTVDHLTRVAVDESFRRLHIHVCARAQVFPRFRWTWYHGAADMAEKGGRLGWRLALG